jgi:hypothetical protein
VRSIPNEEGKGDGNTDFLREHLGPKFLRKPLRNASGSVVIPFLVLAMFKNQDRSRCCLRVSRGTYERAGVGRLAVHSRETDSVFADLASFQMDPFSLRLESHGGALSDRQAGMFRHARGQPFLEINEPFYARAWSCVLKSTSMMGTSTARPQSTSDTRAEREFGRRF